MPESEDPTRKENSTEEFESFLENKRYLGKEDTARSRAEALLKESDRGLVILGAEELSNCLEALLREFMRREARYQKLVDSLFEGFGPLASFSSRIQVAFLFKLIPERVRADLEVLRLMRNEFAHNSAPIDFDHPKISCWLQKLIGGKKEHIDDAGEEELTLGRQVLSREQLIRRLAVSLAFAENIARIEFFQFVIKSGQDVGAAVIQYEKRSGEER